MAKVGNLQQGYQGKLNGQVYYKGADGQTVVRKITTPKNPKTLAQRVQRVITKAVSENYKAMKSICDHSFEGKSSGFECSNRFRQLNMKHMRSHATYLQEQGHSLYEYYNFIGLGEMLKFAPAAVFVSEGSLNQVYATIDGSFFGNLTIGGNTYGDVINALGAQRGDQMTFVTVEKDANGKYNFHYARVILDPRNENGAAALTTPFVNGNVIGSPNNRNRGTFYGLSVTGQTLKFKLTSGSVAAVGIIMSRRTGDTWFRSTCQLVLSEDALGTDKVSLMEAAEMGQQSSQLDLDNELFLNNAGMGGSEAAMAPASGGSGSSSGSGTTTGGGTTGGDNTGGDNTGGGDNGGDSGGVGQN